MMQNRHCLDLSTSES